uniref:Sulfotransferase domain-containing protein n=1 Tax=Octactis speculum TaxID=3111310 RepID=A0A7S2H1X4_9STRA
MGPICSAPPNRPAMPEQERKRAQRYREASLKDRKLPVKTDVYIPLEVGVGVHMHLMGLIAKLNRDRRLQLEQKEKKEHSMLSLSFGWSARMGDKTRRDNRAKVKEGLDACGLDHQCSWRVVQRLGMMRDLWLQVDKARAARCCPERVPMLEACFDYRTRSFFKKKNRSPVMLASVPGSGNTWARMLLEYGTGRYSGSTYDDLDLMSLMPAEGRDDSTVVVVKTHLAPNLFLPRTQASGVIFLVRHPFDTMWAEFQRRKSGGHASSLNMSTSRLSMEFPKFVSCMACKWLQYAAMHMHLKHSGLRLLVVKYEDLKKDTAKALKTMLTFIGTDETNAEAEAKRIACALSNANQGSIHRVKKLLARDVFTDLLGVACGSWSAITAMPASFMLVAQLNYVNYIDPDGTRCEELRKKMSGRSQQSLFQSSSMFHDCTAKFNVNASFNCQA